MYNKLKWKPLLINTLLIYTLEKRLSNIVPRIRFSATVAEEVAKFSIRHVMAAVADARAHRAHAHAVHHLACVAVVPVLVHEFPLSYSVCAQLILQHCIFIL